MSLWARVALFISFSVAGGASVAVPLSSEAYANAECCVVREPLCRPTRDGLRGLSGDCDGAPRGCVGLES